MKRVFCCLALVVSLGGEIAHAADKWVSIRSKNFLLVGTASESQIRRVGRDLEEFREGFAKLFPWAGQQSAITTTVVVFKDDKTFRPFKPQYEGKPGNAAGYFQAGADANFIALSAEMAAPGVVYHEFVHSLTKDALSLPLWVTEGLAEFYSTLEIRSKEMILGRVPGEHIATLNQMSFLPMDALLAAEHGSPFYNEKTKQGIFYAQSWATVHYLMLGNDSQRQPQFRKYLNLTAAGQPIDKSFREAFQTDYPTLEREVRNYIQGRLAWPALQVKLDEKLDFDREMRASVLSEAQGQYYLGDLLLHMNRLQEAEGYLQKAASLDPKFASTYSSLGLLKIYERKSEDALKFLTQAVQSDSQNHMVHYYYAYMLQESQKQDDNADRTSQLQLMRTHLKKSIELAPRFVEAYSMLGYVSLLLRDELDETQRMLQKGIEFAPGRQELRLSLAQVMMMKGDNKTARGILAMVKNAASDDLQRYRAETLLQNLEAGEQSEQALREYRELQSRLAAEAAANHSPDSPVADDKEDAFDAPPVLARKTAPAGADGPVIETAKPQVTRPGGLQLEGSLTMMDCSKGLTLHVRVGNQAVQLHTDTPEQLELVSFIAAVSDTIPCGTLSPALPVRVVYKRGADLRFLGEPVRIEFVDERK